jgi:hypothetical protein
MKGARRQRREEAARQTAALAEAVRPRPCPGCPERFAGAALTVHRDRGQCLPPGAYGQLVKRRDGVWAMRGSDSAAF